MTSDTPEKSLSLKQRFDRWMIKHGRVLVIGIPYVWLFLFFLVPFLIVLKISFAMAEYAQPPYSSLFDWIEEGVTVTLNFGNYLFLLSDSLYATAYLNSIRIAAISTVITLLIGYPMAYGIARARGSVRSILLMLVILPFWTSFLIRVYAWIGILDREGLINAFLLWTGIITEPLIMRQTEGAVFVGIVYTYLPFMILPLYSTLEKMDVSLIEAALDLGCKPWKAFLKVTLPLSMPGVLAGSLLVFIPSVGEFVIPELLGGPNTLMIGRTLWNEFFANRDWPIASAVAIAMLVFLVVPIMWFQHIQTKQEERQS
ncbi:MULTISPECIES: ABC transporter permease subunit [Thalassospira]|uniref:Putrescine ABC transporter permease PotH n=3 Tax=Thalassospira lucentensis TaxID=168935 RepID=A0A358HXF2_9PROT|nr:MULTISPECIES: ABC transporter permease subunit [Thalassospira]HBU99682.1 putrescine ABC transporter permease PotH [Thalassospira lucentensis]|tara:strand:+ start:79587 stop:80528 length:942 start_codon:yes stop_codon:yes gene_type:complete